MHMTDSLGRSWQLGTVQLDYNMPERFELTYTGADNSEHRPVMIHRALFGSYERFIGIMIEHYAGDFPLWLAPIQAIVLPISDRFNDYARSVRERLHRAGLRVEIDARGESIGRKIREAELRKIPLMLVVGEREVESDSVSLRTHGRAGGRGVPAVARQGEGPSQQTDGNAGGLSVEELIRLYSTVLNPPLPSRRSA
jgi:threonyl-tRNA synthetase